MKILLYGLNHAPEMVGIGRYSGELAQWLSHQHTVRVITAPPYFPQWRAVENRYRREQRGGVRIQRCPLWVPAKPSGLTRLLHLASFALSSLVPLLAQRKWEPDVVITVAPAFFCAPGALLLSRLCRSGAEGGRHSRAISWLHVQDFELDAAFELGMLKGGWIRSLAERWERRTLQRFERVSTISEAMRLRLIEKGVEPERAVLLPNWVDLEAIQPLSADRKATNPYRQELGLGANSCVLLYSGSMNKKQGLEMLVEVMEQLEDLPELVWILAGEGPSKAMLAQATAHRANVKMFGLQPNERLLDWLNLADIHLLPQKAGAADLVLPSKLLGILASGRPVVASSPANSELGQLAEQAGLRVDPEDAKAFANAVRQLVMNPGLREQRGRQARQIAEVHYDKDTILQSLNQHLENMITAAPGSAV